MRYRNKNTGEIVNGVKWTGDNSHEIGLELGGDSGDYYFTPNRQLFVHTREGQEKVEIGDYIVLSEKNGYYLCKRDVFEQTYKKLMVYVCMVCDEIFESDNQIGKIEEEWSNPALCPCCKSDELREASSKEIQKWRKLKINKIY